MMRVVLRHASPGEAHHQAAMLLGSAWGCEVCFGDASSARDWPNSGWLDSPGVREPMTSDVPAWTVWRTFYWASTLPEDEHGRPTGSKADRKLDVPEAELRALDFGRELGLNLDRSARPAPALVVDIDHLFAYRGRGATSYWGGLLRDFFRGDFQGVTERMWGPDPFYSLPFWSEFAQRHPQVSLQFFALLAAKKGPYDRGVRWSSPQTAEALRRLMLRFDLGLHLSYGSHDRPGGYRDEVKNLESISGRHVVRQRSHFLRKASTPALVHALCDLGISEDWSDEFADASGFRSGWASAYSVRSGFVQVPVAIMDQNVLGEGPRAIADRLHALQAAAWSVGAPLRIGTHWRIFGPRPDAERNAPDFAAWRAGLALWLSEGDWK